MMSRVNPLTAKNSAIKINIGMVSSTYDEAVSNKISDSKDPMEPKPYTHSKPATPERRRAKAMGTPITIITSKPTTTRVSITRPPR
ncbi:hypothetical protein GCM10011533_34700 [Streptosporangium jomthongense]|nr:hypothetical protein GCM10011533_34700 [Streptosporangium jomthongense]